MALLGKALAPFRQFGQADRASLVGIEQTLVSTRDSIQPRTKLLFRGLISGCASFCRCSHMAELRDEPIWVCEHARDMVPYRGLDFVSVDGAVGAGRRARAHDAILATALVVLPCRLVRRCGAGDAEHGQATPFTCEQAAQQVIVPCVVTE
jgi:hypothetical protein